VVLIDTPVWVDHLRNGSAGSARSSIAEGSSGNPFVTGELALGNLRQRGLVLSALRELPQATVATDEEVPHFIDRRPLFGLGIGYVDAHLLAAVRLTEGAHRVGDGKG